MLRTLFEEDAVELGKQAGLPERSMSLTQLAWLLVLGWWKQPAAGRSALARFAGSLGVSLSKQAPDSHSTPRTADWLLALLRRAVAYVVCAGAVSLPLLQQFTAVLIEDGSSSRSGQDPKTQAALKITVRWDLLKGRLHGP
jgi:hypothetical protein